LAQEELRGLTRTVAEIEWLLLVLVLLYQAFGGPAESDQTAVSTPLMRSGGNALLLTRNCVSSPV